MDTVADRAKVLSRTLYGQESSGMFEEPGGLLKSEFRGQSKDQLPMPIAEALRREAEAGYFQARVLVRDGAVLLIPNEKGRFRKYAELALIGAPVVAPILGIAAIAGAIGIAAYDYLKRPDLDDRKKISAQFLKDEFDRSIEEVVLFGSGQIVRISFLYEGARNWLGHEREVAIRIEIEGRALLFGKEGDDRCEIAVSAIPSAVEEMFARNRVQSP